MPPLAIGQFFRRDQKERDRQTDRDENKDWNGRSIHSIRKVAADEEEENKEEENEEEVKK